MNGKQHRNDTRTIALKIGAVVFAVIFIISAMLLIVERFEGNHSEYTGEVPVLDRTLTYNDQEYELNENLETVLVLGLDKFDSEDKESYNNDKQADFLMLFVIDSDAQTCKVIHLNRDAMIPMNILGVAGDKIGTITQQLALAHTYGNGKEVSCRNTANAVSNMLLGVEIDHYISVTMDAVCAYNDFVGGVAIEILDDFTGIDDTLVKGETITLNGEQALRYVRSRYGLDEPTNNHRMVRQKQYLEALYDKTVENIAADEAFISKAALMMSDYLVSDCSGNKLEKLLYSISEYKPGEILDIDGEIVIGEEFLEYYLDEDSVKKIVVETFYKPVT